MNYTNTLYASYMFLKEEITMKVTVIEKVAQWLRENKLNERSKGSISTDGFSIYSDVELGASFTNYDGKRYNFRILQGNTSSDDKGDAYTAGVKLFELYEDGSVWSRTNETAIYFSDSPSKSSLDSLATWFAKNTHFTKFPKFKVSDFEEDIKNFIYKIDESKTMKVESAYESLDDFFNDKSSNSYESNEAITILAIDTKLPIIKLEKQIVNDENCYKFIVDITNEDTDRFTIYSTINSKERFYRLLESTISALKEFEQFYKYADDLENCM